MRFTFLLTIASFCDCSFIQNLLELCSGVSSSLRAIQTTENPTTDRRVFPGNDQVAVSFARPAIQYLKQIDSLSEEQYREIVSLVRSVYGSKSCAFLLEPRGENIPTFDDLEKWLQQWWVPHIHGIKDAKESSDIKSGLVDKLLVPVKEALSVDGKIQEASRAQALIHLIYQS